MSDIWIYNTGLVVLVVDLDFCISFLFFYYSSSWIFVSSAYNSSRVIVMGLFGKTKAPDPKEAVSCKFKNCC